MIIWGCFTLCFLKYLSQAWSALFQTIQSSCFHNISKRLRSVVLFSLSFLIKASILVLMTVDFERWWCVRVVPFNETARYMRYLFLKLESLPYFPYCSVEHWGLTLFFLCWLELLLFKESNTYYYMKSLVFFGSLSHRQFVEPFLS